MEVQEEIMRLKELQQQIEMRIQELMGGGVPQGAVPGLGQDATLRDRSQDPVVAGNVGGGMPMMPGNGGMPNGGMPRGLLPVA